VGGLDREPLGWAVHVGYLCADIRLLLLPLLLLAAQARNLGGSQASVMLGLFPPPFSPSVSLLEAVGQQPMGGCVLVKRQSARRNGARKAGKRGGISHHDEARRKTSSTPVTRAQQQNGRIEEKDVFSCGQFRQPPPSSPIVPSQGRWPPGVVS